MVLVMTCVVEVPGLLVEEPTHTFTELLPRLEPDPPEQAMALSASKAIRDVASSRLVMLPIAKFGFLMHEN